MICWLDMVTVSGDAGQNGTANAAGAAVSDVAATMTFARIAAARDVLFDKAMKSSLFQR
ncbi:MAG: hypothetical protein KJO95_10465 [Gammaproteobacteria bacterium]|nr:hypothetical protein [Gammaproteobacteria bacterium]NNC57880.1 hypothetical protein [Woeseiaceae bacterium]